MHKVAILLLRYCASMMVLVFLVQFGKVAIYWRGYDKKNRHDLMAILFVIYPFCFSAIDQSVQGEWCKRRAFFHGYLALG